MLCRWAYTAAPGRLGAQRTAQGSAVPRLAKPARRLSCRAQRQSVDSQDAAAAAAPTHAPQNDADEAAEPSSSGSQTPLARPVSHSAIPYKLVAALASVGALETLYLTLVKLFNTSAVCPTSGCDTVLTSAYASLFGFPLPLFGMLTYAGVAGLAAWGASTDQQQQPVPRPVHMGLAAGVTALASTSAYLMYILHTRLGGDPCTWCYLSATLSFTLLTTLLVTLDKRQLQDSAGPSFGVLAVTVAALYFGHADISEAQDFELPYVAPEVTADSSNQAVDLAQRLKDAGAKMYGAFWCTHCFDQKQTFGKAAMRDFPYVECYPDGWKRGVKIADACDAASVKAFPTWVIGGQVLEGELDFAQLDAELQKLKASADTAAAAPAPVEEAGAVSVPTTEPYAAAAGAS